MLLDIKQQLSINQSINPISNKIASSIFYKWRNPVLSPATVLILSNTIATLWLTNLIVHCIPSFMSFFCSDFATSFLIQICKERPPQIERQSMFYGRMKFQSIMHWNCSIHETFLKGYDEMSYIYPILLLLGILKLHKCMRKL